MLNIIDIVRNITTVWDISHIIFLYYTIFCKQLTYKLLGLHFQSFFKEGYFLLENGVGETYIYMYKYICMDIAHASAWGWDKNIGRNRNHACLSRSIITIAPPPLVLPTRKTNNKRKIFLVRPVLVNSSLTFR